MKWKTFGIALGAVLATAGETQANEFAIIAWDRDALMILDLTTARRTGTTVVAWSTTKTARSTGSWDYLMTQTEFDCSGQRQRAVAIGSYNADGTNELDSIPSPQWKPIVPESVGADAIRAACGPETISAKDWLNSSGKDIIATYKKWLATRDGTAGE